MIIMKVIYIYDMCSCNNMSNIYKLKNFNRRMAYIFVKKNEEEASVGIYYTSRLYFLGKGDL